MTNDGTTMSYNMYIKLLRMNMTPMYTRFCYYKWEKRITTVIYLLELGLSQSLVTWTTDELTALSEAGCAWNDLKPALA